MASSKSLELTPWRPVGSWGCIPSVGELPGDAAAQLNSMLCTP